MDVELHDWEVLDDSTSVHNSAYLDGIERDSEGMIRSDYFSLDSHNHHATHVEDVTDQISVYSDNPSWIDPVSVTNYSITKPIAEFSSTDDESLSDSAGNHELGIVEIDSRQVACDESLCDSGEIEPERIVYEKIGEELENSGEEKVLEARQQGGVVKADGDEKNRVGVWWKLPLDLLKYCLFKASPVWTLSMAAAMMGVVILGRRLYRMKQKTRTLQLKVAVDDKKVSQVMSRVARLNEAFSVVKRAPTIRPSLPAAGIAPWPVMALR